MDKNPTYRKISHEVGSIAFLVTLETKEAPKRLSRTVESNFMTIAKNILKRNPRPILKLGQNSMKIPLTMPYQPPLFCWGLEGGSVGDSRLS